jgi:hypothetical protein
MQRSKMARYSVVSSAVARIFDIEIEGDRGAQSQAITADGNPAPAYLGARRSPPLRS